jgi:hypothetical protein
MSHKDHYIKPYDEGTLNKLEIFERYVQTWLPTFIMQQYITEVNIVDFFSGLGYVLEKYRSLIPVNSDLRIFPFSIRKASNIYGIIFGSKHILGVENFLIGF